MENYGKWKEVFRSRYFRFSLLVSMLNYSRWSQSLWWEDPISVMPNLLGFTLGGLALSLAIGDREFYAMLSSDKEENPSLYVISISSFIHFITIQVLSLLSAITLRSFYNEEIITSFLFSINNPILECCVWIVKYLSWFTGYLLFIYSIALVLATAINILHISKWYSHFLSMPDEN